jgi:aryl-alcohol dehydrogenase-like predicted oxidoreductase
MTTRIDKTREITRIDQSLRALGPKTAEHAPSIIAGLSKLTGDTLVALKWALYEAAQERGKIEAINSTEFTPEGIRAYMKQAERIVMPWTGTGSSPVTYVRLTVTGREVSRVDSWLGGYGKCSYPRHHGWGYKAIGPRGQGVCTSGIVKVEWDESMPEDEIKAAEAKARDEAMRICEEFLAKEFPNLTVLHDEIPAR